MADEREVKLQVLICTFGPEGIHRLTNSVRPRVEGVEYFVSWQIPEGDFEIPSELKRKDFRIEKSRTRGLSVNRNIACRRATAPICLISDDDIDYTEEGLRYVMDSFDSYPEMDFATFMFEGEDNKWYPDYEFEMHNPPKNYYVSSIEIAYRREGIERCDISFDERFGVGAQYIAGEEDIFIHEVLKGGLKGKFFPKVIARHTGESTSIRLSNAREYVESKGAVFCITHPYTWPLRMLVHAMRCKNQGWHHGMRNYIEAWINGAKNLKNKNQR